LPVLSKWIRLPAGVAALSVGLVVAAAVSHAKGPVPAAAAEKAVEADIAHLKTLFELAKSKKKLEGRTKATALLIAQYAQDNMDGPNADKLAGLRTEALKVAEAAAKKDLTAAQQLSAGLENPKADAKADKKPMKLGAMHKLELHEVMDLFGGSVGGGMNIEKDIREAKKNGPKDAAAASLIATRTAAIADLAVDVAPDYLPMFGPMKPKAEWDRLMGEMKKLAGEVAAEANKSKPDLTKLKTMIGKLDANCVSCHNKYRDE
jgi:hypothetical protein